MLLKATASTRVCMDCEKGKAQSAVVSTPVALPPPPAPAPPTPPAEAAVPASSAAPPVPVYATPEGYQAVQVREPVPDVMLHDPSPPHTAGQQYHPKNDATAATPSMTSDTGGDPYAPPPSDPKSVPQGAWPGGCFVPRGEDPVAAPQLTFDPARQNWAHFTDGMRKELMGTYVELNDNDGALVEVNWLNLRKWEGEDETQMNGYDYDVNDIETIEVATDGKAFLRGQDQEEWIWGAEP